MNKLKGVIFGIDKVLANQGEDSENLWFDEIGKLIQYILSRGLVPVVLSNREWCRDDETKLEDYLSKKWGIDYWFIANKSNSPVPHKPKAASIDHVLSSMKWDRNETIYVGNTNDDMMTAVNGKVLFLNATWYGKNTDYGFEHKTPIDVGRFIDIFCLRDHFWQYSIQENGLEYYALGIYGTIDDEFKIYTEDAKQAAKFGRGHPEFWANYLLASIYFSGLHTKIDYIAPYPGHKMGSLPTLMEEGFLAFSKCFRKTYLKDLVVRHTTSTKSAFARSQNQRLDHFNQLNSIRLEKFPLKKGNERFKNCPVKKGKTVLIIDDFCTQGYSLEAARIFVEQTGAQVVCLSLLKTIFKDYEQIVYIDNFDPFKPNKFSHLKSIKYPYRRHIDNNANEEIGAKLESYDSWSW